MSQPANDAFSFGISAAEKDDLEKMIGAFRRQQPPASQAGGRESVQNQLDRIHQKLDELTELVYRIDRRMEPLMEVVRLSQQKTERLNRRLDAVIEALKEKGCRL